MPATAPGTYGWAFQGPVASGAANVVHSAALRLARIAVDGGDTRLALWALEQGVVVWPTDTELAELQLDVANALSGSSLMRTWSAVSKRFIAHDQVLPTSLVAHYQNLLKRDP